ncbi:MAG: M20/M25/M40 family metallo-hydrolase [Myxococcota bacterium]
MVAIDWRAVEDEAIDLFRALLRVDTSNPPGNERPAAELLAELFRREGLDPTVIESQPTRANVVARLRGDGTGGGPLLLAAHLDVVPADASRWSAPPFGAELRDGWIWGRGAIDMKNMAAMSAMTLVLADRVADPVQESLSHAARREEVANRAVDLPALEAPPGRVLAPHGLEPEIARRGHDDSPVARQRRIAWASLLARVFDIDALACPRCGGV